MYVQKKMMAKLEQERLAIANQQQLDALKRFASLQQINSAQQQQNTLTAFLAAAMMNKNFILNQQQTHPQSQKSSISPQQSQQQCITQSIPQSTSVPTTTANNKNCTVKNQAKTNNQISRKRSHSDVDTFSSEEEPYCYAKMRQPPSLGKMNLSKASINMKTKLDQNNNSMNSLSQETSVSTTSSPDTGSKQYDSAQSDEEELNGKKQNNRGRNYRKMMIEKRRRDRINNSLNELRRLVPAANEKQGSAKLEKAEILQHTVAYLKSLHAKGFDTFPCESNKFALDYHTIGFNECVNETARYLTNHEEIDDLVKERVITHLRGQSSELNLKDRIVQSTSSNVKNMNETQQTSGSSSTDKIKKVSSSSPSKYQSIKSEISQNQIISNQVHNNLLNLHNSIPSPPSSSVSPSTLSTSSSQSSNPVTVSEMDNSQIYSHLPYTLLKNKILSYNNFTVQTKQSSPILANHHNLNSLKCL